MDLFKKEKKSYENKLWYENNKETKKRLNQAYYAAHREHIKMKVKVRAIRLKHKLIKSV